MKHRIDDLLNRTLAAWVDWVGPRARLVIILDALATAMLAWFTITHLGINMDNKTLLSEDLPFQKADEAFARYFPPLDDSIFLVIEAESPEVARDAARTLADRLHATPDSFSEVYIPGGEPFFQTHGLLYLSADELDDFTDHVARLQPLIADLSRDASIANLSRLIQLGLEQERASSDEASAKRWAEVLDRVSLATIRVFDEYPVSISWEHLMLEGSAFDPGTRQVVITEPVLDFSSLFAAGDSVETIRAAVRELSLVPERGVRVRITGNPALNYEEMLGLAWDVGLAGILSLVLVVGFLYLAFRSQRLILAAVLTLLVGLVWTAAFAAASVGALNVVSITFGVLFIGLGIDFAIHLGMHFVEAVQGGASTTTALHLATQRVGSSLVMCTATTAIGFLVFVPTEYRGVAELGLISGTGMLMILLQTVTLFPALVLVFFGEAAAPHLPPLLRLRLSPPRVVSSHPGMVAALSLALAVVVSPQLFRLRFDSNVVNLRNPTTESVQAFNDLLADSGTSPWYVNTIAVDLDQADHLTEQFQQLDAVDSTTTLRDYVPSDQAEKIEILADAALLLDTPSGRPREPATIPVDEQVAALRDLHALLDADWLREAKDPLAASAHQLRDELARFLSRIADDKDPATALADLEELLLGNLPAQLERLRQALRPTPVTLQDLPASLGRRMVAPDGHARVQIFPHEDLGDAAAMGRFVDAVRTVDQNATGVAVNLVEFARATGRSLRQAIVSALVAITLLLLVLWRRVTETALVLVPLLLAGVGTGALMVLADLPFNFANVVVVPLLLGIGVHSGIHLVHRSHTIDPGEDDLLDTTSARAVFFSAATTIASFGSLAFSAHPGIASMGTLLVCGMAMMLASNLVVLPALIALRARRQRPHR